MLSINIVKLFKIDFKWLLFLEFYDILFNNAAFILFGVVDLLNIIKKEKELRKEGIKNIREFM